MASIFKRKLKDGKGFTWRAVIRIKGYPTICESFERKQEAEDWAQDTERSIKAGQYKSNLHKKQYSYAELIQRMEADGALDHHRAYQKIKSQFHYWKEKLGVYALIHITPELINKERKLLADTPTPQGTKKSASTINRYLAVLSSTLNYAVKRLRWLLENPCAHLLRLKENPGRDRILSEAELFALLDACRASKSTYLYPIVLISLTTGARQGEILGLEWRHIDFENKLAHLIETKNGRPRSIALADPIVVELKKLYEKRDLKKPLVFASKTPFGCVDVKKAWHTALKRANISNYRRHDMRHTFSTMSAAKGASNLALATAMGHRTLQMLQRYTHLDVQVTRKLSNHIADQILQGNEHDYKSTT